MPCSVFAHGSTLFEFPAPKQKNEAKLTCSVHFALRVCQILVSSSDILECFRKREFNRISFVSTRWQLFNDQVFLMSLQKT